VLRLVPRRLLALTAGKSSPYSAALAAAVITSATTALSAAPRFVPGVGVVSGLGPVRERVRQFVRRCRGVAEDERGRLRARCRLGRALLLLQGRDGCRPPPPLGGRAAPGAGVLGRALWAAVLLRLELVEQA